ncbi:MAG: single-stranded-DNA-specific exonuclease RecJ, partial [Defluviitaleaceae bacterium]|nr:single-stranded-DNA-specific exonuclease RecJ [Defluviitaleaceae bacterium]
RTKNNAIKFLNPNPKFFDNKSILLGMDEAVKKAQEFKHKNITIYGDYDVDGVMSTVILHKGLSPFFNKIDHYIPHREAEGWRSDR